MVVFEILVGYAEERRTFYTVCMKYRSGEIIYIDGDRYKYMAVCWLQLSLFKLFDIIIDVTCWDIFLAL